MRMVMAAGVAIVLASCGGGGDGGTQQAATNQPQIAVRSAEQDQLHQLDDMNRNIGLKRAITDSGRRCRRVTESGYVQEYNSLSMWTASCDDGRGWAIFVGPDGSAQVRPCVDMAQLNLPECRINPDPRAPAAAAT